MSVSSADAGQRCRSQHGIGWYLSTFRLATAVLLGSLLIYALQHLQVKLTLDCSAKRTAAMLGHTKVCVQAPVLSWLCLA